MDAGKHLAALPRQFRPRLRIGLVTEDLPGNGLALNALHDEAVTKPVGLVQHQRHRRHRHALLLCQLDQMRFGRQRHRRVALCVGVPAWGPAQDQRVDVMVRHRVKRPCLLAGAARQPPHIAHKVDIGERPPQRLAQGQGDVVFQIVVFRSTHDARLTGLPSTIWSRYSDRP